MFDPDRDFQIGKAVPIREGCDLSIFVTGIMLSRAMEAAEIVEAEGIAVEAIDLHTIKPIDRKCILTSARKTGSVITVEEHSLIGGLGSAVAEVLATDHPVPVSMIGVDDVFGESGNDEELYRKHGLTAEGIAEKVREAVARKARAMADDQFISRTSGQ